MKYTHAFTKSFAASALLLALCPVARAFEPGGAALDNAIKTGEFGAYLENDTAWLSGKMPTLEAGKAGDAALTKLLQDPVFVSALNQRQFIAKTGADKLGIFAKASEPNRAFLGWLLKNTPALELYLEGAVPIGLATREENNYTLSPASLEIWQKIQSADPASKSGMLQRLAIATALMPPGSINIGAGRAAAPADPVVRYQYYKTAQQNKELFPSFDKLTVWEYTHVVSSGATDADLTWARQMVNSFRPDLRADEQVVNSTSFVWRRSAPEPFWRQDFGYDGTFKNVLAGGGKCGPRSSWSVMVSHAFGIPAIGVGQPGHACVAYKAANPMTEPQPGSAWKVAYGAGWQVSKLLGLNGPDFLAGIEKRADAAKFSQVEHLRWFAGALKTADSAAVMEVAHKINDSIKVMKTDLSASLKPEEAEADPGAVTQSRFGKSSPVKSNNTTPTPAPASPVKAAPGVIHVEAATFAKTGGKISWGGQFPNVFVHDSYDGGKQVYFQQQMKEQWADYAIDVPAAGTYEVTLKAACVNSDQLLEVCSGDKTIATVPIALSYGLWQQTQPVALKLEKGPQTLRLQTPVSVNAENHKRGIALRWLELKAK